MTKESDVPAMGSRSERFLGFARFADMVRALNDAGVAHLARGGWFRQHFTWGPPMWEGILIVPCDHDTVLRLLAAFDAIDHAPQFPVSPEIYADPANLRDADAEFEDDDPADTGFIKFLPKSATGASVDVMVVTPDEFTPAYELSFVDEVAPGVAVRVPENEITRRRPLERLCPQVIRDVAVLDATWKEELAPAGHSVDVGALLDAAAASDAAPPIEVGVPLLRFQSIAGALAAAGVDHVLVGAWIRDAQYEPACFWHGHIEIPLRREAADRTFAALAGAGYVPAQPISPEEFLDSARRIHWIDEHQGAGGERERILTLIDPSPGLARVLLVGVTEEVFAEHLESACLQEVGPGVGAVVLDFSRTLRRYAGGGANGLREEWLERWLRADDGEAQLGGEGGREEQGNDIALHDEMLHFPEFVHIAQAFSDACVFFLADGSWHLPDIALGRPRWKGSFVLPGDPGIILRSLAVLEGLGYRPQQPVDPDGYDFPGDPSGRDGDLDDDADADYALIELLPARAGAPPIRLEVESVTEFMEEFRNARRQWASPNLTLCIPEVMWVDYPSEADLERRCPQALPFVARLDHLWRVAVQEDDDDAGGPGPASMSDILEAMLSMPLTWPDDVRDAKRIKGLSLDLYERLVPAMNRTGAPYVLEGAWFMDDERFSLVWDGELTIAQDLHAAEAAFTALASLDLMPQPAMSARDFADWRPEPSPSDEYLRREPFPMLRFFGRADPASRIRLVALSPPLFDNDCELAEIQEIAPDMPVLIRNTVNDGYAHSSCPQRLVQVRRLDAVVKEVVERGAAGDDAGGGD